MKWSAEAEKAIAKVPFFVRKRVRKRVEEEAARDRSGTVEMRHVAACRQRYLTSMEEEVRGFQIDTCFGSGGCPNSAVSSDRLVPELGRLLERAKLREFLKETVKGPLKLHHEFRISVSDCPNACSRPQIADVGILGAVLPGPGKGSCNQCEACVEVCRESALTIGQDESPPIIDPDLCVRCGQCISVCPNGALVPMQTGYRIMLGGKLGRHPQLAREIKGLFPAEQVVELVSACLDHYKTHCRHGERFGEILSRTRWCPSEYL